jgi:hypothetical protein
MNQYPKIKITPKAMRSYKGQRARRQAFYRRKRIARVVSRVLTASYMENAEEIHAGMMDSLRYGVSWVSLTADGKLTRIDPASVLVAT